MSGQGGHLAQRFVWCTLSEHGGHPGCAGGSILLKYRVGNCKLLSTLQNLTCASGEFLSAGAEVDNVRADKCKRSSKVF